MSKIDILNLTDGYRCAPNANIDVEFNYKYFDTGVGSATVEVYLDENNSFSNPTILNISNVYIYNGNSYTSHSSDGTINTSNLPGQFKVSFTFPDINGVRYMKLAIIEGSNTYFSPIILLSSNNTLDFTTIPLVLDNRPFKVKVDDKKKIINGSNISINVYVTNNALDEEPVWENMTTQYLTNQFYTFTNEEKTNIKWAIAVRYLIVKSDYNAGFEIEEIYISHV